MGRTSECLKITFSLPNDAFSKKIPQDPEIAAILSRFEITHSKLSQQADVHTALSPELAYKERRRGLYIGREFGEG